MNKLLFLTFFFIFFGFFGGILLFSYSSIYYCLKLKDKKL